MPYIALTKSELEEVFGIGIITPLEGTDEYFCLNVDHLTFGKYSKMIAESNLRDDLDLATINYNPKRSRLGTFQVCQDDLALFNPQREYNTINEIVTKKHRTNNAWKKLTIPTKIPGHLAVTALLVEHVTKSNEDELKFSYNQVMSAVNKNAIEASRLV